MECDVTLLLSIGDRHKNRAIACPIEVIFWRTSRGISG